MRRVLILWVYLGAVLFPCFPAEAATYRVRLRVQGPQAIQDQIESAVLIALRRHPDVVIAKEDAGYELGIVCLAISDSNLACSSVGLKRFNRAPIDNSCRSAIEKEGVLGLSEWKIVDTEMKYAGIMEHHMVVTHTVSDIPGIAGAIVASFDKDMFESDREYWEKVLPRK